MRLGHTARERYSRPNSNATSVHQRRCRIMKRSSTGRKLPIGFVVFSFALPASAVRLVSPSQSPIWFLIVCKQTRFKSSTIKRSLVLDNKLWVANAIRRRLRPGSTQLNTGLLTSIAYSSWRIIMYPQSITTMPAAVKYRPTAVGWSQNGPLVSTLTTTVNYAVLFLA